MLLSIVNTEHYDLIGLGDFSHGDVNMWQLRFVLLKSIPESKQITIFVQDTEEHAQNIMQDTELVMGAEYGVHEGKDGIYSYGPMERYSYRAWDSPIYLEIIQYIRQNKNRIQIIGVDNGEIARDQYMADRVIKNAQLSKPHIRFFWAANAHVDNREITEPYELKWEPKERYRAGHYLREFFGFRYCIILSTGYQGQIRFNSTCNSLDCEERIRPKIPIFESFHHDKYKKWIQKNKSYHVYSKKEFKGSVLEYTDAAFPYPNHPFSYNGNYDYLIFFNEIEPLTLITREPKVPL